MTQQPRQTPNHGNKPKPEKTEDELMQEAIRRELRSIVARDEARRLYMQRQLAAQEAARGAERKHVPRPTEKILRAAGVRLEAESANNTARESSVQELAQREAEARNQSLALARSAAEALRQAGIQPDTAIVANVGSKTERKLSKNVPTVRRVMRRGSLVSQTYDRKELFTSQTTPEHEVIAYGWAVELKSSRSERGARVILGEDGKLLSAVASNSKQIYRFDRVVPDAVHDANDHGLKFPEDRGIRPEFRPSRSSTDDVRRQILVAKKRSDISVITNEFSSDIAMPPTPINYSTDRTALIIRREESIQDGIADILVRNDIELS